MTDIVPVTGPILDWTGIKLDPNFHDPSCYELVNQGVRAHFVCLSQCGGWSLPLEWIDEACWTVWEGRKKNQKISVVRDLKVVREEREKVLTKVARLNQALNEQPLDLEAIRQRYLGGDPQESLGGYILADLTRLIAEVERYQRVPTVPDIPGTSAAGGS